MHGESAVVRAKQDHDGDRADSACQFTGNPAENGCMKRTLLGTLLALLLPFAVHGEPVKFRNAAHRIAGTIPDGWKEVPGTAGETALKITREDAGKQVARITVMSYDTRGSVSAAYDVWTMTDREIQASGESGSVNGEAVKVLKFGRGEIDRHHMVWTLNRRTLADGTTMWQLAYEGIRGSEGVTVQLTVAGDEEWYAANEAVFLIFIRVLKLSVPKDG